MILMKINKLKGMRKIYFLLTIWFCFNSLIAFSQNQTYQLSLQQSIDYALEHNKTLLNAKDEITSSEYKIKEARAQGLPQIEGALNYNTYFNYEMNIEFGGSSEPPTLNYNVLDFGDLEILKLLNNMSAGSSQAIIMNDQFSGNVQLSQLIFSGQYLAGVQTAKIAGKLSKQNLTLTELDIKENVTNSYYTILITEQTLNIINGNIDNMNEILTHTSNLYNAGVAEETDVDQIKVLVNQLKNSQKSLERIVQLNYNLLKFQLGVAPETDIELSDKLETITESIIITISSDFEIASNINYQMMESQIEIKEKQVDMQNWAYAPTVAGFYSYTEKFKTTGFDMNPNHLAGLSINVPIFSSGVRKAKVSQAKIELEIAKRNKEMLKEQLEIQHKQLVFNFYNAAENYNNQKENTTVAKRVLKSIENKYKQGVVSSLDLVQANNNYLSAENNYLSAVLTLLQAQTALNKLYNKL